MADRTVLQVDNASSSRAFLLGTSENAVRIQIYVAVITNCLVAIIEHDCQVGRTTFNVLRVLSRILTEKNCFRDLFKGSETIEDADDETVRLQFDFKY